MNIFVVNVILWSIKFNTMKFQQFIRKHIPGLRVLPVSTCQYLPGVILDPEKMILLGHCRDVLPHLDESNWAIKDAQANMIYGTVSNERKASAGLRLMGVLGLAGKMESDLRVQIDIDDVRAKYLSINQIHLHPHINDLRKTQRRGAWRMINNRYVVTETFYASEFKVSFYRKNENVGRASLEKYASIDVSAEVVAAWEEDRFLVISQNDQLPFGVRGFLV